MLSTIRKLMLASRTGVRDSGVSVDDALRARLGIELPIVQAPMAGFGGVALAVAVAQAGGLGSLPAAMLTSEQLAGQIDEFRHATHAPLNVNFFCHVAPQASRAQLDAWSESLSRFDAELGVDRARVSSGSPRQPFDDEFCQLVERCRPEVVSFHFGLPAPELVDRVRATGAVVMSSGRPARGRRNRLIDELGPMSSDAPAFPTAGAAVAPLRAVAEDTGSGDFSPLWSGQAGAMTSEVPAHELTRELMAGARRALANSSRR